MSSNLHFVFLQGMPSPFFSGIARELAARGCKTTGINLCVGDWIFWRGPATVNYRGRFEDWAAFLAEFFERNQVTDLVLLGEQRSYHKVAVEVAKAHGVRVTVTDFGYLRPDWITLERNGMSGNSEFAKAPQDILRLAAAAGAADLAGRYRDSAASMARGDLLYSFSNVFLWWLYPHYRRSDRRPHPLIYFPAIGRELLLRKVSQRQAQAGVQSLIESKSPYFVFPLQLEHDFQIVAYSSFDSLADAIRQVIKSFAEHAETGSRLAVKVHPWDPGLKNWRKLVPQWAGEFRVAERVDYFDGGDLDAMVKSSLGMITVNSTSGVRALQLGKPVKVLGQAIYDVPGLTFQGGLDEYWKGAMPPDAALANAFVNAMAGTIQIRGVFFSEPGLSAAASEAAERLYSGTVGMPRKS